MILILYVLSSCFTFGIVGNQKFIVGTGFPTIALILLSLLFPQCLKLMNKQRHIIVWITATWFGTGLLPKVPGTWGSLAAVPFAYIFSAYADPFVLIVAIIALFFVGIWASTEVEKSAQRKDPGFVVVDEVVGQWIALLPLPFLSDLHSPYLFFTTIAAGFLTFRIFDIWKPWPIRNVDRNTSGGLGIMLDDVIAGTYALIITTALLSGIICILQ